MRKQRAERVMACVGAIIGAGFASGQEVIAFFTRYGAFSWLLIVLATGAITGLSALLMRRQRHRRASGSKVAAALSTGCLVLLYGVTGGGMLSASGELIALMVPVREIYWVGLAVSLALAVVAARRSLRFLAAASLALTLLLLGSSVWLLCLSDGSAVAAPLDAGWREAAAGTLRAFAYAGLNVTIGMGVICECARDSARCACRSALWLGLMLTGMLFVENALYLRHPELLTASLPIVRLLAALGKAGYYIGTSTLYLAVFTSLIAIERALMLICRERIGWGMLVLPICLPALFSFLGFQTIVERWYAPVGICCLLLLILPIRSGCTDELGCP
ncbi:MAG: hypothetical protein PHY12_04375 [Eubacteriales bacterium]|nr:hypothetical protein [Eubacteriales bacterium]